MTNIFLIPTGRTDPDKICISHGFPGEMEFSPTSSPYPAQSRYAARAGFGDKWEKTHLSWNTM